MAKKRDQKILLVPVDFTSFSEDALVFASELAKCMSAQLLVLHVIHDPAESPGFYARQAKKKKYLQSMEEAADEMMQEFLGKMRQAFPGNEPIKKATPLLMVGTPVCSANARTTSSRLASFHVSALGKARTATASP